ncbi:hypothetical protein [Scytonema millei]|uniref:Oligosaccharide repeat unit polymerase n=1 Tax=Scytonema millei VB511283 TaxID=1245923 RepID=A0A9X5E2W3_9CYAN|nr:hypothetical protein [Scytonema millei]NHC34195.1 hypothetical protein [Scytonema millei VB511283]
MVAAIAYLIIIVSIVWFELTRKKVLRIDFVSIFNLFFVLFYAVPGFCLNFNFDFYSGEISEYAVSKFGKSIIGSTSVLLALVISYILIVTGFYAVPNHLPQRVSIAPSPKTNNRVFIAIVAGIIISFCSIYIYSSQYGGLVNALADADMIRAGAFEPPKYAFFLRFTNACLLSSSLLFSQLFIIKFKHWRSILYFLFGISCVLSIISGLLYAGRIWMILPILFFIVNYIDCKEKLGIDFYISIAIAFFISILVLQYGDVIFLSLRGLFDNSQTFAEAIQAQSAERSTKFILAGEFEHPYISLGTALNVALTSKHDLRWFSDWIYGFLGLLPDNLIELELPDGVETYNTYYITGVAEKKFVPAGLLAGAVYSAYWLGLAITTIVYGAIGGFIHKALLTNFNKHYFIPVLYVLISFAWGFTMLVYDPTSLFWDYFATFLFILYLLNRCSRLTFKNNV